MAYSQKCILGLRSIEEGDNLCYIVEIEFPQGTRVLYRGENYDQAMLVAEKAHDWLKQNSSEDFDMIIEEAQNQGVSYLSSAHDNFPCNSSEVDHLYDELCDQFETQKLENIHDLNYLFRKMVNKLKFNQYQELAFLKELKKRGYV